MGVTPILKVTHATKDVAEINQGGLKNANSNKQQRRGYLGVIQPSRANDSLRQSLAAFIFG